MAGTILESGSIVEALVLDVGKADKLVELTLKPEFINRSKESSISRTNKKVGIFFSAPCLFRLSSCIYITFLSHMAEKKLSKFFDKNYLLPCYGNIFMKFISLHCFFLLSN